MADQLRQAALNAVAAIAALEAQAEAAGKLWPGDKSALASARGVAQSLTGGAGRDRW